MKRVVECRILHFRSVPLEHGDGRAVGADSDLPHRLTISQAVVLSEITAEPFSHRLDFVPVASKTSVIAQTIIVNVKCDVRDLLQNPLGSAAAFPGPV